MQTHRPTEQEPYPLGKPGQVATYHHISRHSPPDTLVKTLTVAIGSVEENAGVLSQWICLRATKVSGEKFTVWLLSESVPSEDLKVARAVTSRYILQVGNDPPLEFRDKFTGKPVLPCLGAWHYLFPRPTDKEARNALFPQTVKYLGHTYRLARTYPIQVNLSRSLTHNAFLSVPMSSSDLRATRDRRTKRVATTCLIMNSFRSPKPIMMR